MPANTESCRTHSTESNYCLCTAAKYFNLTCLIVRKIWTSLNVECLWHRMQKLFVMSCHDSSAWCHFHYAELLTPIIDFLEGLAILKRKKAHFFCKFEVFHGCLGNCKQRQKKKVFLFFYVAIVFSFRRKVKWIWIFHFIILYSFSFYLYFFFHHCIQFFSFRRGFSGIKIFCFPS